MENLLDDLKVKSILKNGRTFNIIDGDLLEEYDSSDDTDNNDVTEEQFVFITDWLRRYFGIVIPNSDQLDSNAKNALEVAFNELIVNINNDNE